MTETIGQDHSGNYHVEPSSEVKSGLMIPPAEGEERKQLLLACESLLASPSFTPRNLAELMSNMVQLLGSHGSDKNNDLMETPYLVDTEHNKAMKFWGYNLIEGDRPHMWIKPRWAALPEKEGKIIYESLTEPYITEGVGFTYYDPDRGFTYPLGSVGGRNILVAEVSHQIHYPPGYISPDHISYTTGKDTKYENWRNAASPVKRETILFAPKLLGQRLWSAFIDTNTPARESEEATQEVMIDISKY